MEDGTILEVSSSNFSAMRRHACATFPEECCGLIIERQGHLQVVRVTNVQNQLHAKDPEQFPRTAATAYSMRWKEVELLFEAAYKGSLRLHAVYHSHPKHGAYFSEHDRAAAAGWLDDPSYAAAGQIVLAVYHGRVCRAKAFVWDAQRESYVGVPLRVK